MNTISKEQISKLIFNHLEKTAGHPVEFFEIFKNTKGTRFTNIGFKLAKTVWKTYPIKLKKEYKVLNRTLLKLDQRMTWPYYLSKSRLVLFSEMDAFEFTLYQGDLNLWSIKD
jgi:hypothetical protein